MERARARALARCSKLGSGCRLSTEHHFGGSGTFAGSSGLVLPESGGGFDAFAEDPFPPESHPVVRAVPNMKSAIATSVVNRGMILLSSLDRGKAVGPARSGARLNCLARLRQIVRPARDQLPPMTCGSYG